jgi:2-polyprenyl-3-methyl-5-hydroxy-6-metoxy-1,4-benzoquinol methylase
MDDLDSHGEVLDQALRELEVINRLLGGDNVTIDGIARLINDNSLITPVVIGDCGCGGGDLAMKIVRWGRKNGIHMKVEGIDANPHIVEYAREHCKYFPEISFSAEDVFGPSFRSKKYDILTSTLFTHHFTDEQLIDLFSSMKAQSTFGFVINDIHRHPVAYYSIKWLTQLFSKSPMVIADAPLSVQRAFTKSELRSILKRAGITNYTLVWRWAFRWQLIVVA